MKTWVVLRGRFGFSLQKRKGTGCVRHLKGREPSISDGLLQAGVLSLLLHGMLALVLVLGGQPHVTQSRLPAYRVTVLPLQVVDKEIHPKYLNPDPVRKLPPLPARIRTHRGQNEPVQEVRPKEVVLPERERDQAVPESTVRATAYAHSEELVSLSQPPIPLPMAASSDPDTNSRVEPEENLPILLSSSDVEEDHKNATPGKVPGGSPGTGPGGAGLGRSGGGTEGGRGDFRGGGVGIGLGVGLGGSGAGDIGKGQGMGGGTPGAGGYGLEGSGNGKGSGQGRAGTGNSNNDGSRLPQPRRGENPEPVYPREARDRRYEGVVLLRVEVLSNGRVGQIEVKRSSGYEMLDQSAFVAVKQWKFIPAMKGEVAVPRWVEIPVRFRLL